MGELIDGKWHRTGIDSVLAKGELRRPPSVFRGRITADGAASGGMLGFRAERDRYHLYVALACPWAHRTLIMRNLKGLQDHIGLSVAHWLMGEDGWTFEPGPGVIPDSVNGKLLLHQIYTMADPTCTSRASVPVLWDKVSGTIVSNESAEIIRIFNNAFDGLGAVDGDYYPVEHRSEIDSVNDRIYNTLNNGVYRAGFATTQASYEAAAAELFETLSWLEARLLRSRYLIDGRLTEADIRLFTTLVRFDAVYHGHFKCNRRMLIEYPALWEYARDLYQLPAVRPTVDFMHIKHHYYGSHPWINPDRIVPIGPDRDFEAPTKRELLRLPIASE